MYQYVLFDLDGTLVDSGLGVTNSAAYALRKWGREVPDRTSLNRFIGPPLAWSFQTYHGFTAEESRQAIQDYREYYRDKGIYEAEVYPGIEELLKDLKQQGLTLVVATSKPEVFARRILERFGFMPCFDYVFGASMDETRTRKDEVIAYALEEMGVTDHSVCVMVGDRSHDILGAKKNGLDAIGVLFGYGSREELEEAGARFIAETVEDIPRILASQEDV